MYNYEIYSNDAVVLLFQVKIVVNSNNSKLCMSILNYEEKKEKEKEKMTQSYPNDPEKIRLIDQSNQNHIDEMKVVSI